MRSARPLVAILLALVPLAACGTADPGQVVSLPQPAASAGAEPVAGLPAASPRATPTGVVVPALRDILTRLNNDTAATAVGEEMILGELGQALRGQILGLLDGVSAHHR